MRPDCARAHSTLCPKLAVVLLAGAGAAAGMLSVRQERINAAYELTESVGRRADVDRAMLALRIEIARRTTPESTRRLADALGPMGPILRDWCPPALRQTQVATLPIPTDEAINP